MGWAGGGAAAAADNRREKKDGDRATMPKIIDSINRTYASGGTTVSLEFFPVSDVVDYPISEGTRERESGQREA